MAEMKLGMLLRIPVDGVARWRLYSGWGADTSRISTCNVTLRNWWKLHMRWWRFRVGAPYRIETALDGHRYHDGLKASRP